MYCHAEFSVMGRFLFRAQDLNMTNGDFAFFTFRALRSLISNQPWLYYLKTQDDLPRRLSAFNVLKQVLCLKTHYFQSAFSTPSHPAANAPIFSPEVGAT